MRSKQSETNTKKVKQTPSDRVVDKCIIHPEVHTDEKKLDPKTIG